MLKIRLQRVGRIHEPTFRLVVTDSKNSTKSGRFKEVLGSYDPRKTIDVIKADRVKYWLSVGAGATGTVHNLLVSHKIIDAKKVNVLPKKTPKQSAEAADATGQAAPEASSIVETPAEVTPEVRETPEVAAEEPAAEVEVAPESAKIEESTEESVG